MGQIRSSQDNICGTRKRSGPARLEEQWRFAVGEGVEW